MSSTVPAALADLYAKAQAANPGKQVIYGSPLQNMALDYICVGYDEQAGAVTITQDTDSLDASQDTEDYEIHGLAVSARGSIGESETTISTAFGMADALEAEVRADPQLSDTVIFANWTGGPIEILQTNKGPVTAVHFVIAVQAQRT